MLYWTSSQWKGIFLISYSVHISYFFTVYTQNQKSASCPPADLTAPRNPFFWFWNCFPPCGCLKDLQKPGENWPTLQGEELTTNQPWQVSTSAFQVTGTRCSHCSLVLCPQEQELLAQGVKYPRQMVQHQHQRVPPAQPTRHRLCLDVGHLLTAQFKNYLMESNIK